MKGVFIEIKADNGEETYAMHLDLDISCFIYPETELSKKILKKSVGAVEECLIGMRHFIANKTQLTKTMNG